MTSVAGRPRIVREPVEATIRRLETYVGRMEHRYECKSAKLAAAVKTGRVRETAEVSRWLANYETLEMLRKSCDDGHTTGSRTSGTR